MKMFENWQFQSQYVFRLREILAEYRKIKAFLRFASDSVTLILQGFCHPRLFC